MTQMLELSEQDFQEAAKKRLSKQLQTLLEQIKIRKYYQRIRRCKENLNGNSRIEKYNNLSKKLSGWAQEQNGNTKERISEL